LAGYGAEVAERTTTGGALMTRSHRRWHLWMWLILTPLIVVGFLVALWSRPGAN
jgi:hypothetical protein